MLRGGLFFLNRLRGGLCQETNLQFRQTCVLLYNKGSRRPTERFGEFTQDVHFASDGHGHDDASCLFTFQFLQLNSTLTGLMLDY